MCQCLSDDVHGRHTHTSAVSTACWSDRTSQSPSLAMMSMESPGSSCTRPTSGKHSTNLRCKALHLGMALKEVLIADWTWVSPSIGPKCRIMSV